MGLSNAEKCTAYRLRNLEETRAKDRARYYKNREKKKAAAKKRYWEKRDEILKWHREYNKRNKAKKAAAAKRWDANNREKSRRIKQAWVARKKLKDKRMTHVLVQRVYDANIITFGVLTCVVCLKKIYSHEKDTLEHDVPLSKGGSHDFENLGVSHLECNSRKHTRTIKEIRSLLGLS